MKTNRIVTVLAVVLGVLLTGSGVSKLVGETHQVTSFALWGLPVWFRVLVGTFEIIGGVLLVVPLTRPIGSLILGTVMVGALWTHVVFADWPHLVPVSVLLTLCLFVLYGSRATARRLLGGA